MLDEQSTELQAIDLAFRVPVPVGKQTQSYPAPGRHTGATFITEHSALSDQHIVTGWCTIVYYLRAERSGSTQPSQIADLPQIEWPLNTYDLKATSVMAKTSKYDRAHQFLRRSLSMATQTTSTPSMEITIPEASAKFVKRSSPSKNNAHVLKMPLTINITMPKNATTTSETQVAMEKLLSYSGMQDFALIDAQWITKQQFAVQDPSQDHKVLSTSQVVLGKALPINLPPMYTTKTETGTLYTGTIEVVLVVPDQVASTCSFESALLLNNYKIALQVSTRAVKGEGNAALPSYSAKVNVNCNLR